MRGLLLHFVVPLGFWLIFAPATTAQDVEPAEEPVELETGKLRLALETGEHYGHVLKLFFTGDSKQLVSVGKDQTIRYWDVDTGDLRRTLRTALHARPESHNQAVAYSPGGSLVLCGRFGREGERQLPYVLLDPYSGQVEKKLHVEAARGELSVAQSPDRKYLATGNFDGVRVLDAETGTLLHQIKLPRSWGTSVAFTSDSKRLAALMKDQVHVLNLATAKVGKAAKRNQIVMQVGKPGEVFSVIWSADNHNVLVATQDGIDVWDPQSGEKVKSLAIGKTMAMAWDAERRTLLTAGRGAKGKRARVSILDLDSGKQQFFPAPAGEPDEAIDVAFSPDGRRVAAVVQERVIYVWSRDGRRPLVTIGTPIHSPISVGWSKDGKTIAWGTRRDSAREIEERQPLQHAFDLGELRLTKGRDEPGVKKSRDGPSAKKVRDEPSPKKGREGLGTKKGREFKNFQHAIHQQDGVTLHLGHEATVDRGGEKIKLVTPFGLNTCGTLLPGDRAALNNVGGGVQLVDTKSGKRIRTLVGHSEPVADMAPSPDGRYLLTASHDQTLKIWDVAEPGQERLLLTFFAKGGDWVMWTPEGYYAATPGGEDLMGGTIHNAAGEIRTFYPAERFRAQLYRPDVIARVLEKGSVAEALKVANNIRKERNIAIPRGEAQPEKLLPPLVVLEISDQKKLPKITVKVSAEQGCPEQPIRSLRLFVDGHPLPGHEAAISFDSGKEVARHAVTWEADVPPGRHTLSVMARGKDDTPNFSNPIVVNTPLPEKDRPVVHLVAVGVSQYDRKNWNLNYAHSDAQQLAQAVIDATRAGKLYREASVKKLVNQDATREGVLKAIDDVRKAAKANDLFVFSFAGHGIRDEGEFYLMTREADPSNGKTLEQTALPGKLLREKLADFPCQVLLLLDACHSGALGNYRPGSDDAARALADVDVRVAVMCAALGHEEALERDGSGLFTAAIVRALEHQGEIFYDKETGELNVYHLQAFVYQEVTKASEAQQTPYLKMPLAQPAFVVTQFAK